MAEIGFSSKKTTLFVKENKFIIEATNNFPVNTISLSSEFVNINTLNVAGRVESTQMTNLDASMLQIHNPDQSYNNIDVSNDIHLGGKLLGPEIMVIDPAPHDDGSGVVIIKGDLQVVGELTQISLSSVEVSDNILRLSANYSALEVGGLEVIGNDDIPHPVYWSNLTKRWDVSDSIFTQSDLQVSKNADINGNSRMGGNLALEGRVDTTLDASFSRSMDIVRRLSVTGDVSLNSNADVSGTLTTTDIKFTDNLKKGTGNVVLLDDSNNLVDSACVLFDFSSVIIEASGGIKIPIGNSTDRPPAASAGYIRYNTTLNVYEGHNGSNWVELGRDVQDTDKDTYITAETSYGADNDSLDFYTAGVKHLQIDNSGSILIGAGDNLNNFTISGDSGNTHIAGSLLISSNTGGVGLTVHDDISVGRIFMGSHIYGASTMYIDPFVHGNNTGLVVVRGGLDIQGTQTTFNSTTVEVSHNIIVQVPTTLNEGGLVVKDQNGVSRPFVFKNSPDFMWDLSDSIIFRENIEVKGDASFNGNVKIHGDVSFNGAVIFCEKTELKGDSSLNGHVDISENLYVNGDVSFQRNLDVSGKIIGETMTLSSDASFNGKLSISDRLDVYSDVSLNGTASINTISNLTSLTGDCILNDFTLENITSTKLGTVGAIQKYIEAQAPAFYASTKIQTDNRLSNRQSLSFPSDKVTTIKENCVLASLDNKTIGAQEYSFGQCVDDFYVAVGSSTDAKIKYSYDAHKWFSGEDASNVLTNSGLSVDYNGMLYVAVGSGLNTHAVSLDGKSWKGLGKPLMFGGAGGEMCNVVKYENGIWVCGGFGGNNISIGYSFDGTTWHAAYGVGGVAISDIMTICNGLAFNGLVWVAAGVNIITGNTLAYSEDGIMWHSVTNSNTLFSSRANNVASNGGVFLACGLGTNKLARSIDGVNWTVASVDIMTEVKAIATNGNTWVTGGYTNGYKSLEYSTDNGNTFKQVATANALLPASIYNIYWSGKYFIGCGDAAAGTIVRSVDGINWKVSSPNGFNNCKDAVSNNRMYSTIKFDKKGTVFGGGLSASAITNIGTLGYETDIYNGINTDFSFTSVSGSNDIFTTRCTGIAHSGKLWVATGGGSKYSMAYSYNGSIWYGLEHSKRNLFRNEGKAIAYNGQQWIATGKSSPLQDTATVTIAHSHDGLTWVPIFNSLSIIERGDTITWIGDKWVIGGIFDNRLATSADGITWTSSPNTNHTTINTLAWNGKMLLCGGDGTYAISWSSNGLDWTPAANTLFIECESIAWSEKLKMWIAVGKGTIDGVTTKIGHSFDGINWISNGGGDVFSNKATAVFYNGDRFVAFGLGDSTGNTMAYSDDGFNWVGLGIGIGNSVTACGVSAPQTGIASIASKIVAVGETTGSSIGFSSNGLDWGHLSNSIFQTYALDVAYNGTIWVAVGEGNADTIAYSYDGIDWVGAGKSALSIVGRTVEWNGHMWLAGGEGTRQFATSHDGINWTPVVQSVMTNKCKAICWTGLQWIALGAGSGNKIATSPDGVNWTGKGTSIFNEVHNVATTGLITVAAGYGLIRVGQPEGGRLVYTYDGIDWNMCSNINGGGSIATIFTTAVYGVATNGRMWVAVGEGTNTIAYSIDGKSWTAGGSPFSVKGNDVVWNGKYWIAVGEGVTSAIISFDGIVWINIPHTNNSMLALGGLRHVVGSGHHGHGEIILNKTGPGLSSDLIIHAPRYYADYETSGYSAFNATVKAITR
ncbi:hypothetical protein PGAG_00061 [Phaeocystis globosa virus 12T]|uniref:Uncharacterized protein n=1 Tax=Phaeocystis globosa virus PgV-16T TaxID=3071227 RepID=A0AC59EWU7_9VIRU|nr:baseplate wedge subunit [Phaeocystis globosa virus]AET72951.1 hypothetical protein PGAG_00061 [Phaeocystis globosa virus 12T]AET73769.1 hypothetical protein PGBG_00061 [Phaeocystis globosa virus 14T]AGM15413.1 hypothetical protein PGCG_00101 [Phaeocystis globosa virus PgV-16T]